MYGAYTYNRTTHLRPASFRGRLAALAALCIFCSCLSGSHSGKGRPEQEVTLEGLSADMWTYYSLSDGLTVGQSEFANAREDSLWAERGDWDFAIAGDYIKTNGGTSGKGEGGIFPLPGSDWASISEGPADGYIIDEVGEIK